MRNLWGLLVAGVIALGLVVAAAQAVGPEMPKGKAFVNKSPAFSFVYPQDLVGKPLEVPAEVLRVASYMGLPAFVCVVTDAAKGATLKALPQAGLEGLRKDPRYTSKSGWKLESQQETKLADGTPAIEYELGWDWQPGLRLYTMNLAAITGGKIVACSVTSTDAGNKAYKKYLYSLKLQ